MKGIYLSPWDLPQPVLEVADLLHLAGHSVHLVGGAVRDLLLGRKPKDWDVSTAARPDQVATVLSSASFHVVDTGSRYGTLTAVKDGVDVEVTTYRRDANYGDHRHPDHIEWADSIEEDLARRDLTVNALAWDPLTQTLVDPYGGLDDLLGRAPLRTVGEARDRFMEDPLRILRLYRFSAVLDTNPEGKAREAALELAPLLDGVARERVGQEMALLVCAQHPATGLRGLNTARILQRILPSWDATVDFDQHTSFHAHTVDEHLMRSCAYAPPEPTIRWAALLHDLGKPATFFQDAQGVGHFYGHPEAGAALATKALQSLRQPVELVRRVNALVREHMFPWEDAGPAAYRRLLRRLGSPQAMIELLGVTRADRKAQRDVAWDGEGEVRLKIREVLLGRPVVQPRELALSGDDVMQLLRVGPGPAVGETLRHLLDAVTENPALNTVDDLTALVQKHRPFQPGQDS